MGGLVYILGSCGPLQQTFLWDWECLLLLKPQRVFTARGFEALFPYAGTLGWVVCLAPQLFLPVYPHMNMGPPSPPAATSPTLVCQFLPCCMSSLPQPPISVLPTSLDECFFFNPFIVGLSCSLIFWQFWLFSVFKLVVILLLIVQERKLSTYTSILSGTQFSDFFFFLKIVFYFVIVYNWNSGNSKLTSLPVSLL